MDDTRPTETDFSALGAAIDAMASRSDWLWPIGQDASREWTVGRSMSPDEVAVVESLKMTKDRSPHAPSPFHAWWLGDEIEAEKQQPGWPSVWAATLKHVDHPAVAAHLADLVWVSRHGNAPHTFARRAVEFYLAPWPENWQSHDRNRALMRAFDLAHDLNDPFLISATEQRLLDLASDVLDRDDKEASGSMEDDQQLDSGIRLLEHCATRKLSDEGDAILDDLILGAQQATKDPFVLERLSKMALPRVADEAQESIVSGVIQAFRNFASDDVLLRQVMFLRQALRVAQERGHPSHASILHEIETLDTEDLYAVIRVRTTLPGSHVSDFCKQVVGEDNIENALTRFANALVITPELVETTRKNTKVGLLHTVTHQRIGEANSIITTTGGAEHGPEEAVERDVIQQVGDQARMASHLLLSPALQQLLAAYEPWEVADIQTMLGRNAADETVAVALSRGLDHFRNRRYDDAAHIALPRVERLIRHIARERGVATTKKPTKKVGGIRGLGEILIDLRGDGESPALLPEPLLTSAELTLVNADSLNLRNDLSHGITGLVDSEDAALILQLGVALALTLRLQPDSGLPTSGCINQMTL